MRSHHLLTSIICSRCSSRTHREGRPGSIPAPGPYHRARSLDFPSMPGVPALARHSRSRCRRAGFRRFRRGRGRCKHQSEPAAPDFRGIVWLDVQVARRRFLARRAVTILLFLMVLMSCSLSLAVRVASRITTSVCERSKSVRFRVDPSGPRVWAGCRSFAGLSLRCPWLPTTVMEWTGRVRLIA